MGGSLIDHPRPSFSSADAAALLRTHFGIVGSLAPLDSVERIEENFRALMSECQVSDVRVLADIQPDRVDGVPFLVTCNDAAARPA